MSTESEKSDENVKFDTQEKTYSKEFENIMTDFINDLKNSFTEYHTIINTYYNDDETLKMDMLFQYVMREFPEKFFDILYENDDFFENKDNNKKELLPGIDFVELWNLEGLTDSIKEKIWKYLQLLLFSVVSHVKSNESFGDTAKLFEAIDENEFKEKLEKTISGMSSLFEDMGLDMNDVELDDDEIPDLKQDDNDETDDLNEDNKEKKKNMFDKSNLPNADDIHKHISSMMEGKLGKLATEIAEETAAELDIDLNGATNEQDVFKTLFKNPSKLMGLVKKVGGKLDSKIKAGDIKESELMDEASELMKKMKDMPGMDNIQDMLKKMNIPGMGKKAKFNKAAFDRMQKMEEQKEKIREKVRKRQEEKSMNDQLNAMKNQFQEITPEEQEKRNRDLLELIQQEEEEEKNKKQEPIKKKKKKKGKK